MTLPAVALLEVRSGGLWEVRHDHGKGHDAHEREAERFDPHLWLSPANAAVVVRSLAAVLSELDPANAERYRANSSALQARIRQLDRTLTARLEPVRDLPYLVFHDAYHYFEHHYDLNAVGAVTLSPEQAPGARRLHNLRSRIEASGARCLFREPQFEPRLVETLVEGTETESAVLDPLGADLAPGPDAWFQLLEGLADTLVGCLSGPAR